MRYYRVCRQVLEMEGGGGRVDVAAPALDDGVVYAALHDYGDDRGMIVAVEDAVDVCIEELQPDDVVVASHLEWFANGQGEAGGRFVLNNGLVEAAH